MRKVADILESMGSEREFNEAFHRSRALGLWRSAVDPPLSEMCVVTGFDQDALQVCASHPAVCMEIRSRSAAILGRINALAGREVFRRIVVRLSQFPQERLDKV